MMLAAIVYRASHACSTSGVHAAPAKWETAAMSAFPTDA
jgi:hypothetical protein